MIKNIKISSKIIGENRPCFIIAEAGVNHNGKLKLAKKMIDDAKSFGADAIKFQTYITEELVTDTAPKAQYQTRTTKESSQFAMLKSLELSQNDFKILKRYCKDKKIIFLSSCFDVPSALFLNKINVPAFKLGSGEITNTPLLMTVAKFSKPIILSTGMTDLSEVKKAVKVIKGVGNKELILLHCTTDYPARVEEVNLKAMETIKREFNLPIGFSDHTPGILISVAARAMGACVIEKHFTLDKKMSGPDHKASLDKTEFRELIESIRIIESAFGDGKKIPQKSELNIRSVARKSIVTRFIINKDDKLTLGMLAIKRPGTGIAPEYINKLVGRRVKQDISANKLISWKDLL